MGHDVYVCCAENDNEISDAVCQVFEENGIVPWIKSRNMVSGDSVDKIVNAISDSKCFVLILSKHSKDANYIITETDLAFSRNVPIIAFNVDNSRLKGNLEFILENKKVIPHTSDSKRQLEELVRETSRHLDRTADNIKINSKSLKTFQKANPHRRENSLKKHIMVAIPIIAILILVYFFIIAPTGQHTTDDGVFVMNMTQVDVHGNTYIVRGESYNMPSNPSRYFMHMQFFDKNDEMVYEVNSTADEFKAGVMWSGDLQDDNVTHVEFKLTDLDDNILSEGSYVIE